MLKIFTADTRKFSILYQLEVCSPLVFKFIFELAYITLTQPSA